jgi:antitoxin MazE
MMVIKTKVVKIGNSRGVRIPKTVLDQVGFAGDIEIVVGEHQLVLRPAALPRMGWEEQFRRMAEQGDDRLLDPSLPTAWDEAEWEW